MAGPGEGRYPEAVHIIVTAGKTGNFILLNQGDLFIIFIIGKRFYKGVLKQ